jgi:hypothetical protein
MKPKFALNVFPKLMLERRCCFVWAIGFAFTSSHFWQSPQK